nr:purine/pyrimidine permease [Paenibacillus sp. OK003]
MQSTLITLGIAGFYQGFIGHKFPIHEGPAGLWWSIFTIYANGHLFIFALIDLSIKRFFYERYDGDHVKPHLVRC